MAGDPQRPKRLIRHFQIFGDLLTTYSYGRQHVERHYRAYCGMCEVGDDLIISLAAFFIEKSRKKRETTECNSHSKPLQSCVHGARRCCCRLLRARCSLLPFYAPAMPPPNMLHRIFKPVNSVRIVCLAYSCPVYPAEVAACCLSFTME